MPLLGLILRRIVYLSDNLQTTVNLTYSFESTHMGYGIVKCAWLLELNNLLLMPKDMIDAHMMILESACDFNGDNLHCCHY